MWQHPGQGRGRHTLLLLVIVVLALIAEALIASVISTGQVDVPRPVSIQQPTPQQPTREPSAENYPAGASRTPRPRTAAWPTTEAHPPSPVASTVAKPQTLAEFSADAGPVSAAFIDEFLARQDSPMQGMGSEFWSRGHQYDLDPRLLVAISGNETGFGRFLTSRYNAFNWFYAGTWDSHFESWAEAIEVVSRGVRDAYFAQGRSTIATLGEKYGPRRRKRST